MPLNTTTPFDLDKPYVIFRRVAKDDAGDLVGYMIWIEKRELLFR